FLAERTVRAHREQALTAPFPASRDGYTPRRRTHIDEPPSEPFGGGFQFRNVGEPHVHAAYDVEALLERGEEGGNPAALQLASDIGDADHQRARSLAACLCR